MNCYTKTLLDKKLNPQVSGQKDHNCLDPFCKDSQDIDKMRHIKKEISGWGKYPVEECLLYRPERLSNITQILRDRLDTSYIARGQGRSYADTSLNQNGGVILFERLNRFLDFDSENALLTCEAGLTLKEILEVFLPQGYTLPVVPGTQFVTVGGAIANDIHGKNHHQVGSFGNFVLEFELLLPHLELKRCSRDENQDLYWATLGGIGLTGIITKAKIQLKPVQSAFVKVDYEKTENLFETLESFESNDSHYEYSVAWIDCLAKGKKLGRSVLMRANNAGIDDLPGSMKEPLTLIKKKQKRIPFHFPSFSLNSLSVSLFNKAYYMKQKDGKNQIVDWESYFFPLDSVLEWNKIYGKRGFVQYQLSVPIENGKKALAEMMNAISQSKQASFLAVLKKFGASNQGWLSFPSPGYTLALDLPVSKKLWPLLNGLQAICLNYGGKEYLAKDAIIQKDAFEKMYPKAKDFQELKKSIDPNGLLTSSMSRRIGLT